MVLLGRNGEILSPALASRPGFGHHRYRLIVPADRARRVVAWLRHLSDGYVRFDDADLWAKLPGPVVVRDLGPLDGSSPELTLLAAQEAAGPAEGPLAPPPSHKPYFIGVSTPGSCDPAGEALPVFEWQEPDSPLRRTPLSDWHEQHGARMAPFAGWEMPLWYSSIADEHRAVRGAAGLFDVSHMGLLEASGPHAAYFLNLVTTNDVYALRPGESQYSYLLNPEGQVIDDVMLYMLAPSSYLVVVNAGNTEKDWAWLNAVNARQVRIDGVRPWARASFQAELRDLHDPQESYAWLVDIALQGPRSRDILLALLDAAPPSSAIAELRGRLLAIRRTGVLEAHVPSDRAPGGMFDLIIARTGYTGERMGFEIFAHPDVIQGLWELLLEVGAPYGLRPTGLGARDSLRIEAGLPLYGHELAGPLDLRPDDADFAGYVKLNKAFFVGRRAFIQHAEERKMSVIRFGIPEKGVRIPKQGDIITESHGRVIGQVTSCALDTAGYLVGLAHIDRRHAGEGTELNIFPHPTREGWDKPYDELTVGDRLVLHSEATVVKRFMRR